MGAPKKEHFFVHAKKLYVLIRGMSRIFCRFYPIFLLSDKSDLLLEEFGVGGIGKSRLVRDLSFLI